MDKKTPYLGSAWSTDRPSGRMMGGPEARAFEQPDFSALEISAVCDGFLGWHFHSLDFKE